MHMADALVSATVAATMYVASGSAAAVSLKRVKLEHDASRIPVMGVMGAFVFAAQMLNFTIPGTGSSGHLCGGLMVSALLGPYAGFITMIGVLLLQCLLFADGGVLALGANIWNMAFYGCFIGALLIWRPIMKHGASRKKILIASILGCVLTLEMGAFSVVLETNASGITELPFALFAGVMLPIHLAIGLVEGLITASVLIFIYEARPEMLWGVGSDQVCPGAGTNQVCPGAGNAGSGKKRFSLGKVLGILALLAVLFIFGISRFASTNPDGLEWSLEKMTGSTDLESHGALYSAAEKLQEFTALFPDYAPKETAELTDEDTMKTTLPGLAVAGGVVCLSGIYYALSRKKAGDR